MTRKIEYTGQVEAEDAQGNTVMLDRFTVLTSFRPVNGAQQWVPGSSSYKLDGEPCSKHGDGLITDNSRRVLRLRR